MEIARLILDYLRALIWPCTAIGLALLFRVEIRRLLTRLRKAVLPGGLSLELDEKVQQVRALSLQVEAESRPAHRGNTPGVLLAEANAPTARLGLQPTLGGLNTSYYRRLADTNPNLSLAALRINFGALTRELAKRYKVPIRETSPLGAVLTALRDASAMTRTQFDLATQVLRVCDQAIHGEAVSREQALEVIGSAGTLFGGQAARGDIRSRETALTQVQGDIQGKTGAVETIQIVPGESGTVFAITTVLYGTNARGPISVPINADKKSFNLTILQGSNLLQVTLFSPNQTDGSAIAQQQSATGAPIELEDDIEFVSGVAIWSRQIVGV